MSALRARTISGLKWSGASQVFSQIIKFAVSILLARLLDPASFGLMAMVIFFTGIGDVLANMGLGAALVQRQELDDRHTSTVFWVNLLVGALLALLLILLSPWIAGFYDEPQLEMICNVVSITFIINSFQIVQRNLFTKSMAFKTLFRVDTIAVLISGSVAVGAALWGLGVWSLVVQSIVLSLVTVLLLWFASEWRPKMLFSLDALRDVLGFSLNLLGFNLLNYGARNLDNLIIGRMLGSVALGFYARAYSLMLLPIQQITNVFTRVMFPALATIQDDKPAVKRIYLRAIRAISLVSFPMMIGLIVIAEPFVIALLGEKWRPVIPILQILSIAGMTQPISSTVGWIFTSQGRTDILLKWGVYSIIVLAAAFFIGVRWGVIGVSVLYSISGLLLLLVPSFYLAGRLIDLGLIEIAKNLAPAFLASLLMAVVVYGVQFILPESWGAWVHLILLSLVGVSVYWAILHVTKPRAYTEVMTLLLRESSIGRVRNFSFARKPN